VLRRYDAPVGGKRSVRGKKKSPGKDAELLANVLGSFSAQAEVIHQSSLAMSDPRRAQMERASSLVTWGVDVLRTSFPNPRIRALMRLVWDLVGQQIVPFAYSEDVPVESLHVAAMQRTEGGPIEARVFMPANWVDLVHKDVVYQLGALVYVGSQAVDAYNAKPLGPDVVTRARAHEAEFLLTQRRALAGWRPNAYQRHLLRDYPKGLDSPSVVSLLYTSKPTPNPPADA
jgi:hypothetical protein